MRLSDGRPPLRDYDGRKDELELDADVNRPLFFVRLLCRPTCILF
jgi:hypothetical protein